MLLFASRQESLCDLVRGCVTTRNMVRNTLAIAKEFLLTGQEQAGLGSPGCSLVRSGVSMPKMAQYTWKWMLTVP